MFGYIVAVIAMHWIGRKAITTGTLILGGVICAICGVLFHPSIVDSNEIIPEFGRWLSFGGKLFISATFGIIWVYVCELYPTSIRSSGTAGGSMAARIGAVSAPYILLINVAWLPYVIFSAMAIFAGVTGLYLRETRNKPIPNTIREMNNDFQLKTDL